MSRLDKLASQVVASGALAKATKARPRDRKPTLPSMPSTWDMGATGPANQARLREEPATDFDPETGRETQNPNGIKRRRRDNWVRIYGQKKDGLEPHHVAAAEKLRMASEGMRERDPLARIGEISGRGGDPQAARVDARQYFRSLWAAIPTDCRPVIERVVLDDEPIWCGAGKAGHERHMQRLKRGLDAIA